ncbi:MAG: hypothetical protein CL808_02610 [Citromicrobium sp.]|nr:hypothetical protein [Citromicrobium sp.]
MIIIHLIALAFGVAVIVAVMAGRLSTIVTDPRTGHARSSVLAPGIALAGALSVAASSLFGLL